MLLLGSGADEIIELARTTPDNLIAMCTHGRSGVRALGAGKRNREGRASFGRSGFGCPGRVSCFAVQQSMNK